MEVEKIYVSDIARKYPHIFIFEPTKASGLIRMLEEERKNIGVDDKFIEIYLPQPLEYFETNRIFGWPSKGTKKGYAINIELPSNNLYIQQTEQLRSIIRQSLVAIKYGEVDRKIPYPLNLLYDMFAVPRAILYDFINWIIERYSK